MSKKSHFRGCFDKQHGKRIHTLLKSASQHLYHIHLSLERKLCSKKSLLLRYQILGLLVNTLPTDEKYPVLNRDNLTIPIHIQLSLKEKILCQFFTAFLKSRWIFELLTKKMTLIDFVIPKLRPLETRWDKDLKSPISENPSTSNMVNVNKHCRNLYQSTFMIFIDHCEVNWLGKSLCFWEATSWDCLLTHWLPMKCILFLIETI